MPPLVRLRSARPGPAALNLLARRAGLRVGVLRSDDLPAAQRLLYRVYFDELGWDPPRPNASNLRADHAGGRFVDDFDASAIWIGLFSAPQTLVGVTRLIDPALSGGLEIARYAATPAGLGERVGEVNRVALLPAWRNGPALALLWAAGAWGARRQGFDRVIGSVTARVFERSARHAGWRVVGETFRYHARDPDPVLPVAFDPRVLSVARVASGMMRHQVRRRLSKRRARQPSKA